MEKELATLHFPRGMRKKLSLYALILEKYKRELERVSKETNVPIINLDELIKKPQERDIFTDSMHIKKGAEIYARFISSKILKNLSIENHKRLISEVD